MALRLIKFLNKLRMLRRQLLFENLDAHKNRKSKRELDIKALVRRKYRK